MSMMMRMMIGAGMAMIHGMALMAEQAPLAEAKSGGKTELQVLAEQYQAGDARAKDMARERDRLALQAQSAIIGLKDAELQMERARSAARELCGREGKALNTAAAAWDCVVPKPAGKDVEKK